MDKYELENNKLYYEQKAKCPPSILCLDCALWNEYTGCEHGRKQESTAMAIFGYCGLKKTKEEQHRHEIQKMNRFLVHGEY